MDAVIRADLGAFERHVVATGDDVRVVDAGPELRRLLGDPVWRLGPEASVRRAHERISRRNAPTIGRSAGVVGRASARAGECTR